SVFEIIAPNKIIGKTLGSLDLRKKYKVSVLGIKHGNKVSVNPSADDVVYKDDILIVLADSKSISSFAD
ncbi:MAG: cation:proton antiporter regulatory subunit, partial [Candidatus Sericytochromatia bacterium]